MAQPFLQRAAEQKDVSTECLIKLAEIHERRHRLEDAQQYLERALKLETGCAPALLARSRLYRQSGKLIEAEQILRSIGGPRNLDVQVKSRYELGGVLDRQGRYNEAMAAFIEAKSLLQPEAARHAGELRIVRNRLEVMKSGLSAELFKRWFDSGKNLQPQHRLGLLGGHPRSGTSLLEQIRDSHPDIVSAEETGNLSRDEACECRVSTQASRRLFRSIYFRIRRKLIRPAAIAEKLFPLHRIVSR